MSAFDWAVLVIIVPLALWGWWLKLARWREKQRRLAEGQRQLRKDLREGRL